MREINILTDFGVNINKSLELLGDMQTYDETLSEYFEEMKTKINQAYKFAQNNDLPNYAVVVHGLKSASRYLGFEVIGELFYQHELEAKHNNFAFVANHFQGLVNEVNKVQQVIVAYLNSNSQSQSAQVVTPSAVQSTNKILIVADDSGIIQNIIKKSFEKSNELNLTIEIANNGEEVLELIEKNSKECIAGLLLDLNMPKKDGFEVLEHFKQNSLFEIIPVSIISGNDDVESVERAFQYPIIDMIRKPFSESDLKSIVTKTVNSHK